MGSSEWKLITLKWIDPQANWVSLFVFVFCGFFFFASIRVSGLRVVIGKVMIDLNAPFIFYSGECFDRFVVLYNSRICVCEYPVGVSCPRQPLTSAEVLYMCVCVCVCVCVSSQECFCVFVYRHIYIYIYIVIHRQTVSLYHNSSV